jgi:hypothetical protein
VGEVAAQQQLPFFGQCLAIEQIGADVLKPPAEEFVNLQLPIAEFGSQGLQKSVHFIQAGP